MKIETVEKYSHLIFDALLHRCRQLETTIKEGREVLESESSTAPKIMITSLRNTIEHCEELLRENRQALRELKGE